MKKSLPAVSWRLSLATAEPQYSPPNCALIHCPRKSSIIVDGCQWVRSLLRTHIHVRRYFARLLLRSYPQKAKQYGLLLGMFNLYWPTTNMRPWHHGAIWYKKKRIVTLGVTLIENRHWFIRKNVWPCNNIKYCLLK